MRVTASVAATAAAAMMAVPAVLAASQCNEWSPCYREGYCNSNAMFCMWGLCDSSLSYNSTSCWQPESCLSQTVDFTSSSDAISIDNYSGNPANNAFVSVFDPDYSSVANGNLVLSMKYDSTQGKGFGATVDATHTFLYGKATARVKTASVANGVVSSFIFRSDVTGDEIDFEWVGKAPTQVQTNYYYRDVLNYQLMIPYTMADTSADYHDYTFDWSADQIVWSVDGTVIRTLNRADTYNAANGTYAFPDTMGRVAFSIWDGGNSGAEGTEEWAGTPTPWTASTVYSMYVESITIECSGSTDTSSSSVDDQTSATDTDGYSSDAGSGSSNGSGNGASSQQKCIPRPTAAY
ncbi:putative glycosidase CRH2 [Coemansia sp. RSA 2399]|nr:putative glycosidase CRH2 [Coemansia sp. RSA 2399]KAJ1904673.1 putative glycosidase CRH2 [Coemansia sp. IMI 209127]